MFLGKPFGIKAMVILMLLMVSVLAHAQEGNNSRTRPLDISTDTLVLDSLSIIPGSLLCRLSDGRILPASYYHIDYAAARFFWKQNPSDLCSDGPCEVILEYRVYPFLFTKAEQHKEQNKVEVDVGLQEMPSVFTYQTNDNEIFKFGGLDKNGSISRGVSFGNNQDVVVNSSLNLQLSGKLSEEIGILAAITDNNIPIQPEGNTQQLQDFDKVYIQLFTKKTRLWAGDFELSKPESYFMNLSKKGQGGLLTSVFSLDDSKKPKNKGVFEVAVSGAVSKGKYTRNALAVTEGNQGPYKLSGSNGEVYIIILAGSEKVYVDGVLLTRGADNDYIIDYNLGEITFTPKILVTRDKRITVEFEYSDKVYARSMYFASAGYRSPKGGIRFNFFSEQDLRNQPIQQELSESDKLLLYNIGDSTSGAVIPNVDSIAFNTNEVLYKMIDTVVNSQLYDSIFVYSTNADSAHYRLGFSNVGQGRGNYVQVTSAANGRVFQWVAPVSGQPSGTHEPVMLLVAPKRTQMYTLGGEYRFGKNTFVSAEVALSNKDVNTFSPYSAYDDLGMASRFRLDNTLWLGKDTLRSWRMLTHLHHDYIQQYFSPIERFRSVEFDRDWNAYAKSRADEHLPGISLGFENSKKQFVRYSFDSYLRGSFYKAWKHGFDGAYDIKKFYLTFSGSYLSSQYDTTGSHFLRQKASLIKKLPWFSIGFREETEDNRLFLSLDSLIGGTAAYETYEAFISNPDSAKIKYQGSYKRRYDRLPQLGNLNLASIADDASLGFELSGDPMNVLKITATYRDVRILDSALSHDSRENTLLGRLDYYTRKLKKVITSSTHYEIGSGLEVKKEFTYVEVPPGQGLYAWTDYNENGIKELNEFDVAAFSDQANYIRVFLPTQDYIRAYYNQFSEALNIDPAVVWSGKKGIRKLISRFALQFSYRVERKTSNDNLWRAYNPFSSTLGDTSLLSLNSTLRAVLFFNRNNPVFSCEAAYQDNRNKVLLVNGFDARLHQYISTKFRWNITRKIMLSTEGSHGWKNSSSDYFPSRNYRLLFYYAEPRFSMQFGKSFRAVIIYSFKQKLNKEGVLAEKAVIHNAGLELKLNFLRKGSLQVKANYIPISYNGPQNNSLAYEMLEGYKKGSNLTWNLSYQRNISDNLQLSIIYDGRQSTGNKIIHVGSVQLRAYF